jgi:hypothetical protein
MAPATPAGTQGLRPQAAGRLGLRLLFPLSVRATLTLGGPQLRGSGATPGEGRGLVPAARQVR